MFITDTSGTRLTRPLMHRTIWRRCAQAVIVDCIQFHGDLTDDLFLPGKGLRGDVPDGAYVAGRSIEPFAHQTFASRVIEYSIGAHYFVPTRGLSEASARVVGFFPHRILVEEVPRILGQQEYILMALGRSICHALRHGVGLAPDDV